MALALQPSQPVRSTGATVTGLNALVGRVMRPRTRSRAGGDGGAAAAALIIGGDASQRRFCETLLQALGVRVDVAGGCRQALLALERGRFGLVILDGAAPGLDDDFWARLGGLFVGRPAPWLYLVTDRNEDVPWAALRPAALRAVPRPVRALTLVEAAHRLR
jgi:DNA-binding NtrC family response regulator